MGACFRIRWGRVPAVFGFAVVVAVSFPAVATALPGDANCDGTVDQADMSALIAALFESGGECAAADVNGDGGTSAADIAALSEILGELPVPTPSPTPVENSPLPSPTNTATVTPTPSGTPPTSTPSATLTVTGTATRTPSITRTPTRTRVPTRTRTATRTRVPTRTRTPTRTHRPTRTRIPTKTPTVTRTPSITRTPTISRTPTRTRTPTMTPTASRTRPPTHTRTASRTPTATRTPVNTRTVTATRTITQTPTVTLTPTVTPTLPVGPLITYFGIATADNHLVQPSETTPEGVPVFVWPTNFGFLIVVEGRSGSSGRPIDISGTADFPASGSSRAGLQIRANRSLGDGSAAVCDVAPPDIGGVPGVDPPTFDSSQATTDALNDFACRFDSHVSSPSACTFDALGNFSFANPATKTQFCSVPAVGSEMQLAAGDTLLAVQLRDTSRNIGNRAEIIVRVP